MRTERSQFGGKQAANPAVAENKRVRALQRDRQFFHGKLERTFGGGYRVSDIGALVFLREPAERAKGTGTWGVLCTVHFPDSRCIKNAAAAGILIGSGSICWLKEESG